MKLTWIGHSCWKLESGTDTVILDPYADGSVPGLAPVREQADLVLCSHEHGDHNARETVTLTGKQPSFTIETLDTYHDEAKGAKRGPNTIHIVSDGKTKVVHLGDLGCALTDEQILALRGADVLLIPVGGFFTINADQAVSLVRMLCPKTVIPMHYRSKTFGYPVIGKVDAFAKALSAETRDGCVWDTDETETLSGAVILQPQNRL